VEHHHFDYNIKLALKKPLKMSKLCKRCERSEVETYVHFSSMYFLLFAIVAFHFAFFFIKLHIYMMKFYSGHEVQIVFSSFYFPFVFWTTFFLINDIYGTLKYSLR